MADNNQDFLTAPIDDYLLSIAEALQQAQQRLYQNRILSSDGQSSIVYQIPKLDFELKMTLEIDQETTRDGQSKPVIKGAPVSNLSSTRRQQAEAASTIKGTFVAVPSDGGSPPPIIKIFLKTISNNSYEVTVHVQSAVGKNREGVKVEFNINRELSKEWSKQGNITFRWYELEEAKAVARVKEVKVNEGDEGEIKWVIEAIDIIDPGRGYVAPPIVEIIPDDPGEITEEAIAVVHIDENNEMLREIELENQGEGYTTPPEIKIHPPSDEEGNIINIPKVNVFFDKGIIYTDERGIAKNMLILDGLFPKGISIVAVIDVLGKTETIVFTP